MATISRQQYNDLYGPTVGDKIRLGDTDLYVEITKDLCVYGDEVVYGGGKTLRDGMGLANTTTSEGGTLDLVITNVTIIDPILGVIKADVGVKDGKIAGIGKAGNPNIMRGVTPGIGNRSCYRCHFGRTSDSDSCSYRRSRTHDRTAASLPLPE